jgi:hypothetical protein
MKCSLLITLLLFSAMPSFAQFRLFGKEYSPGVYYTKDGQKRQGLIAIGLEDQAFFARHPDRTLYFKANKDAEKEKIKASTLKAFVIANRDSMITDSFVTIYTPDRYHIKFEYDFVRVLYGNGPVNLYDYEGLVANGGGFGGNNIALTFSYTSTVHYYYYGKDADNSVTLDRKDFKDVMSKMLTDDPQTAEMILKKQYRFGDMQKMIKQYNINIAAASTSNKPK